ncbi:hypothetical protein J2Y03_003833 [Neobacillus niacini]|uniref:hypothetical protein n=1 Tax=Neobacillus niacini TaxID=86668 RepID=UPI00285F0FD0|nr:hypothetical protein [Neobacillus niacini]MDR7078780.1 hypothetical protein [Neobacillus niacini]
MEWKKEMMREQYWENCSLGMEKRDDEGTILGESFPWTIKKKKQWNDTKLVVL